MSTLPGSSDPVAPIADVAVIGAGPAGLAASTAAAEAGASVVCLDANDQPGGQFWRHAAEDVHPEQDGTGHHGWATYQDLRRRFDAGITAGRIGFRPGQQVWMVQRVEDGFILRTTPSHDTDARDGLTVRARRLVIAAGGYDRQLPVPGWDLPGVMAAGGIQGFIKTNHQAPGKNVVIAGTGPFLLPVAANVVQAGGRVLAVCESTNLTGWAAGLGAAARVPAKGLEGAEYAALFLRNRIPYRLRTGVIAVLGDQHVEAVQLARLDAQGRPVPGTEQTLEGVDTVGFGWGFTPQVELPVSLGAQTRIDTDGSLVCVVDDRQQSTVPGLYLAGEVTGVGGAVLAVAEGEIAGRAASGAESDGGARLRRTVTAHRAFAQAMHTAHPVPQHWQDWLEEDTIVCRCEEVTAGDITAARDELGAEDARTVKSMTRAGMGWCQGRVCGFAASCIASGAQATQDSLRSVAKRPVAHPVALSDLAALDTAD
ncbi:FAD-dependent oxidoreductase (plasmid) [Citricoccus sp. SGAir0253]|uniref:NAD(P)/FAD-dependent oxidoreductase n=1 Tax=Citricoccus sp. SGAir0253 TaxID=2567881 RepID=UPI0010CD6259|nr:NAD(P)/FAD-dependent oxidoreductase [Citricoccus sp. SGAir0253]QCU79632.1 FAD-dependent oxidoreductase [Citricoccus sp. SGAir0253]